MFRKPKKKPAALRSGNTNGSNVLDSGHENVTVSASASFPNAKKRRRSRGDSSSEEEGNREDTHDLLEQIRQERDSVKSTKKQPINTSSTIAAFKPNSFMQQYKSSNDQLTAKEMATRTAEHHPIEKMPYDDAAPSSINASLPSLQSNQPRNKFLAGPLKAPTFVRTTARFDYQPDICKDYKETGFCGFGDTCIYLHDRGDTKSGWEMEREYEEKKKKDEERREKEVEKFMNEMNGGDSARSKEDQDGFASYDIDKECSIDDGIPFACHICRGPFQNPIVTTCNHYFCESCISSRIKESGMGCPVCQKATHGVLNFPQKLVAKKRRLVGRDGSWEEFLDKSRVS
ncbi:hypothetical protein HJC23_005233 [Cyclotella cryptica]|uniref:RING-type E3 ubiquitin transferase n=1 Tax=Cyclotella cryptica TaxID=29204 RepID=A0ABD3NVC5_9STRA|eukprot:CCRYP_019681-RA/>CCRYP_019681-RA protein AED:0.00 eAED:0.00 QI:169/-1/1/1/-1/1/1/172/343